MPFAVRTMGTVHPQAYRRWVTVGILAALVAYALVTIAGLVTGGTDRATEVTQAAVLVACGVALVLVGRGRLETAAYLALAAVWAELQSGLHRTGLDTPGLVALPALVVAVGLLRGGRSAWGLAAVTSLTVGGLALGLHPALVDASVDGARALYAFLVLAATLFAVAALVDVAMRTLEAALEAGRLGESRQGDARRLDSIARLAGGIAHDFNNQLTVIGVSAELLFESEDPEVRSTAEAVLEAQSRASLLTAELVAFAERDLATPRRVRLDEVVRGALPMLTTVVGGEMALDVDLRPSPAVMADPKQVGRVAASLVSNARDALGGRGRIRIAVLGPGDVKNAVVGGSEVPLGFVELRVEDEGPGMPPETVRRVREPFFTTAPASERRGLGLSAVHGMAIQNGGEVVIDTEEGRGTSMRVRLPVAPGNG